MRFAAVALLFFVTVGVFMAPSHVSAPPQVAAAAFSRATSTPAVYPPFRDHE